MQFKDFVDAEKTLAMVISVKEYYEIKPLLREYYSDSDIKNIDEFCLFKPRSDRFLLCNPRKKQEISTPMMYLNAVTFVTRVPYRDIAFVEGCE